jgi:hypothetical protein
MTKRIRVSRLRRTPRLPTAAIASHVVAGPFWSEGGSERRDLKARPRVARRRTHILQVIDIQYFTPPRERGLGDFLG